MLQHRIDTPYTDKCSSSHVLCSGPLPEGVFFSCMRMVFSCMRMEAQSKYVFRVGQVAGQSNAMISLGDIAWAEKPPWSAAARAAIDGPGNKRARIYQVRQKTSYATSALMDIALPSTYFQTRFRLYIYKTDTDIWSLLKCAQRSLSCRVTFGRKHDLNCASVPSPLWSRQLQTADQGRCLNWHRLSL